MNKELKDMTFDEIETRKSEIVAELDNADADLDALEEEMRSLNAEIENRKNAEAKKEEIRNAIAEGKVDVEVKEEVKEERKMNLEEVRNSKEYIDAFAEYIKTGRADECRALLTENATNGTIPVPTMVYDIVKTAWEKEGIMSRVKKAYLKGNLKVGFEISSTGAVIHTEGADAIDPETLTLGIVELKPESIKKWVPLSDEALDMRGEAFLKYIYDEVAYHIAKKSANELVAKIKALGTSATSSSVGVPVVVSTQITISLVAEALGKLSDEATNPVIMMNKATWSQFKAVQYANKYAVDPFEGLDVVFNNTIVSFADATTGVPYVIVGDLGQGALANFPNGEGIEFKFDDKTLMTSDLVRILGRQFVGLGIVADKSFVKIMKEEASA